MNPARLTGGNAPGKHEVARAENASAASLTPPAILAPLMINGEADHMAVGQVTHHQRFATQVAIP